MASAIFTFVFFSFILLPVQGKFKPFLSHAYQLPNILLTHLSVRILVSGTHHVLHLKGWHCSHQLISKCPSGYRFALPIHGYLPLDLLLAFTFVGIIRQVYEIL